MDSIMAETNYKKKIVSFFLDKKLFLSPENILNLDKIDLKNFYNFLKNLNEEKIKTKSPQELIQIFYDFYSQKKNQQNPQNKQENIKTNVIVLKSHEEIAQKREVKDFVKLFNDRYDFLSKIIQNRPEMKSVISIKRLKEKTQKEDICIIGLVKDRRTSKSGHLIFNIEDPTGDVNIIVNKNRKELFDLATSVLEDEVIGIRGVNTENAVFANNILLPDLPVQKVKKTEEEIYAIFLSDMHVGSNCFLKEKFEKFLSWISCESGTEKQKQIASKVKYLFIAGDLIDGVGIYPKQEDDLVISDLNEQYILCAEYLKKIPPHIKIIACTGNHEPAHIAEPQPPPYIDFAKPLYNIPNITMVGNPSLINIHRTEDFEGFNILLYHGYSFDYFIANVDNIRLNGGYDRSDLVMKHLLQRRHLAPTYGSTPYVPTNEDHLLIKVVPDFFVTGHIHKCAISSYKNVTLICGSCWQSTTSFQEKLGHHPEPARVPIVNLKTREMKILKF
jgi:DNA polymerase II small subunit